MRRLLPLLAVACASPQPPVSAAPPLAMRVAATAAPAPLAYAPNVPELTQRMKALAETRNFRIGIPQQPTLSPDGTRVYFLRGKGRDPVQRLYELTIASGAERELIAPDALLASEVLTPEERARRERLRISAKGFTGFQLSEDGKRMLLPLGAKVFLLNLETGVPAPVPLPAGAFDPHLSHDGRTLGYVLLHNVYVLNLPEAAAALAKEKPRQVTKNGTEEQPFGTADFLAQEEFDRTRGWFFSPDDRELLVQTTDNRGVERLSIVDPASPEQIPERPFYPRVGKSNPKLGFVRISLQTLKSEKLAVPAERYVADVAWKEASLPCLLETPRAQTSAEIACYGAAASRIVVWRADDAAWVNAAHMVPLEGSRYGLAPDGDRDVVSYIFPVNTNLTPNSFKRFGAPTKVMVLRALGGTQERYYALVTHDGLHAEVAALGLGVRSAPLAIAKGSVEPKLYVKQDKVLSYETQEDQDPVWHVRALQDGYPVLATLRNSLEPHTLPEVHFVTLGAQGIHAAVVYPTRNGKRIPNAELAPAILDSAYGGPTANVANANALSYMRAQWMADATGAIVVSLDGRGTPRRGRDWERAIYKNFGVILEDHLAALDDLAAREFPGKSVRRGIYGWSFGGYLSAYAAIKAPDTFAAAFVGAPPADWRDYDSAYTERYLGFPIDQNVYDAFSLPTLAKLAPRVAPLLLVHGMADDNVFFLNALKLSAALAAAGHSAEFWPLPKTTHMLVEPELTQQVWLHGAAFLRTALQPQRARTTTP
jgi:dipeptidyl-peptidase 4